MKNKNINGQKTVTKWCTFKSKGLQIKPKRYYIIYTKRYTKVTQNALAYHHTKYASLNIVLTYQLLVIQRKFHGKVKGFHYRHKFDPNSKIKTGNKWVLRSIRIISGKSKMAAF